MPLESATYLSGLDPANPDGLDNKSEGDNHLRLIKSVLQATFPGFSGRFARVSAKSSNYPLAATDNGSVIVVTASGVTISTGVSAATFGNGFCVHVIAESHDVIIDPNASELINGAATALIAAGSSGTLYCDGTKWFASGGQVRDSFAVVTNSADPTKKLRFDLSALSTGVTRVLTVPDQDVTLAHIPPGVILDFGGVTAPSGWLLCDGAAVSRTTYASLFSAIGTTFGAGDGSTTFNVPDFKGRTAVGVGVHTLTEVITGQTASSNALTVPSNNVKWITGMPVTLSNVSGFTGISNGPAWIIRASATSIRFASSLGNAQNGIPITLTGVGNVSITYTETSRSLGEAGGEASHAMSITELLSHSHGRGALNTGAGALGSGNIVASDTAFTGGNSAMNIMQPFLAVNKIVKH